ncbi:MAG: DinB family protein [SAR202 cluster bacterium]|jgi:uncharacterized damage-inducible protein DinB|nr:DinB family protein [SAR202 cluster bacterium]MDP6716332.1 DinB family protein [SAR202 cluster bacterium]
MELLEFATDMFEEYGTRLYGYLDGLTTEELNWRPNAEANSIAFIVWHTARVEDRWFQIFCQNKPDLWTTDSWFEKLGMGENQPLTGLTPDDLAAFPTLTMDDLKSYFDAVRAETRKYLSNIGPQDLETAPGRSPFGGPAANNRFAHFTIQRMFRQLIQEEIQHLGQVGILRGLQRGLDK